MHEQIFLGGAPVVGFGDEASEKKMIGTVLGVPAVGFVVGVVTGAVLGHLVKEGAGTVVGAIVGGVGGTVGGIALTPYVLGRTPAPATSTTPPTPPVATWRRIPVEDVAKLKAGQQYAAAVAMANGAPLLPAEIAAIDLQFTALKTAPVNLPFKNFASYPPGAKLPSDWPKDDDLGPNAYRISADLLEDAPADAAGLKNLNTESFTADGLAAEVWVRP